MAEDRGPKRIVTWEEILDSFKDVDSARYFHEILRIGLRDYESLRGKNEFGTHADDHLTGAEILRGHQNGDLKFQTMGRQGGIDGRTLKADITKNTWQKRRYEVRRSSVVLPRNWFPISEFVARISRNREILKALITVFGQVIETARNEETDAAFGCHVRKLLAEQGGVDVLAAQMRDGLSAN
jgi:hypothetical protein